MKAALAMTAIPATVVAPAMVNAHHYCRERQSHHQAEEGMGN